MTYGARMAEPANLENVPFYGRIDLSQAKQVTCTLFARRQIELLKLR